MTQKFLVVSDIHGDFDSANAMAEAFSYHQADQILCLGDILYHGPRNVLPSGYAPKKVIQLMNQYKDKIIAVRGNCDGEVDQMVLEFPITSDYNVLYFENHKIFMSHGHIYSPDKLPPLNTGAAFLSGHTHIPTTTNRDGILLLNPGSIALPKQNHPQTYAILDENGFTIYTLDHQIYMHTNWL
ncbi:MAG: phosphodiesterase [Erysipelotrichaceae bacterium]|nr:phosphodiesterase [Erysipelotrichaceae bacterium]MDY6035358.1 phosphodiesterase [Bulleidia sp.]